MNSYERTIKFLEGEKTDHPPFMPLIVDWAVRQQNADYMEFVNNPKVRADVYLKTVRKFHIDCIMPASDFYEQLSDFGMELKVVNNRYTGVPFINDIEKDMENIKVPEIKAGGRMANRLEALKIITKVEKNNTFIFGHCIGPFTEFCNARNITKASMDVIRKKKLVKEYLDIFFRNGMQFIEAQIKNGADGIIIVEPTCSLISPKLYEELIQPLHTKMVELIQKLGGISRLHVCGNTNNHVENFLATRTRILDGDYQVDMGKAAKKLGKNQYLCGNLDPANVVLGGTPQIIAEKTKEIYEQTENRAIIAAGCDVPEYTSAENMVAFYEACAALK